MARTGPITSEKDLKAMMEYLYEKSYRDYMMFAIGIHLGLRISDFIELKVEDFRRYCQLAEIEAIPKKTDKRRKSGDKHAGYKVVNIPIPDLLLEEIETYIEGQPGGAYMFPSREGDKAIGRHRAHQIIDEAAENCGIRRNIGCHGMRKTFGYWHYKKNRDIRLLMEMFNHSSPEMTLRYIGVTDEAKRDSMRDLNLGLGLGLKKEK